MRRHLLGLCLLLTAGLLCPTASQAQLTHRWSFDGDATDSVGSSDWAVNGATFSGGEVVFDGVDDFLELTTTPLPTASGASTTIEVWGTYSPDTSQGSRIFDFATADGDFYMYLTPNRQPQPAPIDGPATSVGWDDDFDIAFGPSSTERARGTSHTAEQELLTLVVDADTETVDGPGIGQFRLYRDGALIGVQDNDPALQDLLLSLLSGANANRLGHGVSLPETPLDFESTPAFLNGSINEMRIYGGALTESEQFISAVAGPDALAPSFTDTNWTAGTADWSSGANWSAGVPAESNRAVIGNGGTANVTAPADAGLVDVTDGSVAIGAGGDLNAKYPVGIAANSSVIIGAGGRLTLSRVTGDANPDVVTDELSIDGGAIRSGFSNSEVGPNVSVVVGAGGATFQSQSGQRLNVQGIISGSSSIDVEGDGRVALSGGTLNEFTGTITVNNSTLDLAGQPGDFQSTSMASQLILNNGTVELDPGGGGGEVFLTPIHATDGTVNHLIHRGIGDASERPPNFQGGLTGDGTLVFSAPDRNSVAIGLDFGGAVDHSQFTGRYVIAAQPDTMNIAVRIRSDDADFANAVFEIADDGSWIGKRGTDTNTVIEIGGLAGVAGARVEAAIAGAGDPPVGDPDNRNVTFNLGGADEDVDFAGRIHDTNPSATVSITKVGDNTQTLSGNNDYSGPTIVESGLLLVNGVHASLDDNPLTTEEVDPTSPVGDYTVQAAGALGGAGVIGRASDTVNVSVLGGTLAPGDGLGVLTVEGAVSLGDGSTFAVEGLGAAFDKLVSDSLSIGSNVALDVAALGSITDGSYVIAEFGGALSGTFASVTSGFTVDYGTPGQIILTASGLGGGLTGDYNDDGVVDAADYTVWRDALGTAASLDNDPIGGVIGTAQYDQWVANYGATEAASAGASAPEPGALLLAACLAAFGAASRRAK